MIWASVPPGERSIVRSYINSDQPADVEKAKLECARLGLDYQEARRLITLEMVAEQERNEPARAGRRKGA